MGFSLKKYIDMENEYNKHMHTFLASHKVPIQEQLPEHRRSYVLFLTKLTEEINKLPKDYFKDKLTSDQHKSLILAGAMLTMINQLEDGLLRKSLIVNMGNWDDTSTKFEPNSKIPPRTLSLMMREILTFYRSLMYEESSTKELFQINEEASLREDHPFTNLEPNFLVAFMKTGSDLYNKSCISMFENAVEAQKNAIEVQKKEAKNASKDKKSNWGSWWFSKEKEKDGLDDSMSNSPASQLR